ncbi:MAG: PDDEXK nuclease domain-containing protein [Chitinispirillales bacterium]|jgi:predicted nuclease of restriction endonuclease-like (RecB) superfamily|nr:PDDEXK nuclease domain-containing protein [Chitinispirillales bacterium]
MADIIKLPEYRNWLHDLKQQIRKGQIKAALSVNSQMIMMYWDLGRQITEKQETARWGSGFIEQLSKDLRKEFPEMSGFSLRNLQIIKQWYLFYSQSELLKTKQLVSQLPLIPWGHHVKVMQKVKNVDHALFYIRKTLENNWSRSVLEYQIETNLYSRQGKAVTNFNNTLPEPQSDLANEIMKDPYNFDFLRLAEKVKETDIEKALVGHISHFLPELGIGFAYMGRQYLLKVGKKEYRTDLLFWHTRLKCYIVIELKAKEFEPEFVGKLNFYISAIDELVKDEQDKPTIGILLCKNKDNYEVEFSLKNINTPIGVSTFHYTELADDIKAALPSVENLQNELINFEREYESQ